MKHKSRFPSAQGYPGNTIPAAQVRRATGKSAIIGAFLAMVLLFVPKAYDYWQDDRPVEGTFSCEDTKEAIFKDPALRQEPPVEFIRRVNAACK